MSVITEHSLMLASPRSEQHCWQSRSSAFAVVRLMINSNVVGCWTGRVAGSSCEGCDRCINSIAHGRGQIPRRRGTTIDPRQAEARMRHHARVRETVHCATALIIKRQAALRTRTPRLAGHARWDWSVTDNGPRANALSAARSGSASAMPCATARSSQSRASWSFGSPAVLLVR